MLLTLMLAHFFQTLLDNAKNALLRVPAFVISLACRFTEQQRNRFLGTADRMHGKLSIANSLDNLLLKHQVLDVGGGYDHPLGASEFPGQPASAEKAFNLLVHATNGLNLSELVHRPGNRQVLPDRQAGQRRHQGTEFRQRSTVTVHFAVVLFEGQAGRQMHGIRNGKMGRQPGAEDHHPFRVNITSQLDVPFDIHHTAISIIAGSGDTVGQTKLESAGREH